MATTSSPTWTSSELPSAMVGSPVASTLTTARSLGALCPRIRASRVVPSENTAWILWAPSITWLLVTITPSDEITNPVPAAPPESGPPSSTSATTAGTSVFRICAMSPVREMRSDGRTITAVAAGGALVVERSSSTAR